MKINYKDLVELISLDLASLMLKTVCRIYLKTWKKNVKKDNLGDFSLSCSLCYESSGNYGNCYYKRVQQSLMDLENTYQVKVEEVESMLNNITNIYEKLNVPGKLFIKTLFSSCFSYLLKAFILVLWMIMLMRGSGSRSVDPRLQNGS